MDITGQLAHTTRRFDLQEPTPQTPTAPVAISPAKQSIAFNELTTFTWQAVDNADTYEFELFFGEHEDTPALHTSILATDACVNETCSLELIMEYPSYGAYNWRVRALNDEGVSEWSDSNYDVLPPPPNEPVNLLPLENSDVNEGATVTFTWQEEPLAATYDFHFFDWVSATEIDFEFDMLPEDVCLDGQCALTRTLDLPISDDHVWRVRARNAGGVSDWSRSLFNIIEPVTEPPAIASLIAPAFEAVVENGLTQSFTWAPATLASAYEFQLINGDPDVETLAG